MIAPAGAMADVLAEIGIVLIAGSGVIFVGVMTLLALALRRRREESPVSAWRWVVGGGVVFPILVLSALLAYGTWRSAGLSAAPRSEGRVIAVTGKLWWWEVRYRGADGGEVVLANEIRVPVGRPVTLGLSSMDVIHSFWVPALAGKVDMVPGRVHQLRLSVREPGVHRGQCAEFCGLQHARMALHVVAMPAPEFDRWLQSQALPAAEPADPLARRGRQLFGEQRCSACHAVRGLYESPGLGPDLTHVGSRLHIAAGTLPTHRGTLAGWIAGTQDIKPGALMPSFDRLSGDELHALAAFLEGLK
jgi:cytochrome c oxidase subunit 2